MKSLLTASLALLLAPAATAVTIVSDDFTDLDRTKTGALDADWWSSNSTSGNSVEIDVTGLGMVTGTSGRGIHATFSNQNLGIGDSITATLSFTTPTTIGINRGGAFKFALMDGTQAGLAADLLSSSSSVNPLYTNLPGYMVDLDVNTGATADTSIRKHTTPNAIGRFLGTTSEWSTLGTSSDNGYTFAPNTDYTFVMSLTRTGADSMDIFGSLSDASGLIDSHTESDTGIANNIGMLGIWANSNTFGSTTSSDPDNGVTFTNVTVEVIPEPSSAGLMLLGGMFLLRRRRS